MIKNILKQIKEMDASTIKAINNGLMCSFIIGILGLLLLVTYNMFSVSYDIYQGGFILVKTGMIFSAETFGCGFIVDRINNGRI